MLKKMRFSALLTCFVRTKFYDLRGKFSVVFFDCGVVFFRGVYVAVTEYVGNEIDVACGAIEVCAERTAQFMRRYFFERSGGLRVFFDDVLNCSYRQSCHLQWQKHGVRIAFIYLFTSFDKAFTFGVDVGVKGVRHFVAEIQYGLIAAFSRDGEGICFKIYVRKI